MEVLTIQITNKKALKLLFELEALSLIKILKQKNINDEKLSNKYAGKLNKNIAAQLQQHISKSRNEWDNNI